MTRFSFNTWLNALEKASLPQGCCGDTGPCTQWEKVSFQFPRLTLLREKNWKGWNQSKFTNKYNFQKTSPKRSQNIQSKSIWVSHALRTNGQKVSIEYVDPSDWLYTLLRLLGDLVRSLINLLDFGELCRQSMLGKKSSDFTMDTSAKFYQSCFLVMRDVVLGGQGTWQLLLSRVWIFQRCPLSPSAIANNIWASFLSTGSQTAMVLLLRSLTKCGVLPGLQQTIPAISYLTRFLLFGIPGYLYDKTPWVVPQNEDTFKKTFPGPQEEGTPLLIPTFT